MSDRNIVCLGSIKTCKKCQKPVALRYWYSAWRCGANHRAIGCKTVAVATVNARRLAAGLCPPGGDGAVWLFTSAAPGGGGVTAGQFSASIRLAVSRWCQAVLVVV
ncbi:hypothetical protein DEO72_LG6g1327 [Vigna unguiculata]|uniref:Uncharacterized protein n=1 Tax=Vigna unguiculata TaxID=3917 RepID=A0A4D6M7F4_VIGUN|nr:hypothetical protein DEO72_LG6g1327 [Vigna unguiculata]